MLCQTQVDQVIPYFQRFMRRFPSVNALAEAPVEAVLKEWEGLGYYARARNAHRTAQLVSLKLRGRFPRSLERIRALPGIGPYTAAAMASLAFGLDHAVLDGNVMRVLCRLTADAGDIRSGTTRRRLQSVADALLIRGRAAEFNESMMELGALICTPRNPACAKCPLRTVCAAYAEGAAKAYPRSRPRGRVPHKEVGAAVLLNRRGEVLVARRKADAMLGGLWEFPGGTREPDESMSGCVARELHEELGITIEVGPELMVIRHAYSHFTIALHAYWARIRKGRPRAIQCDAYRWLSVERLRDVPFSRADLHIVNRLQENGLPPYASLFPK